MIPFLARPQQTALQHPAVFQRKLQWRIFRRNRGYHIAAFVAPQLSDDRKLHLHLEHQRLQSPITKMSSCVLVLAEHALPQAFFVVRYPSVSGIARWTCRTVYLHMRVYVPGLQLRHLPILRSLSMESPSTGRCTYMLSESFHEFSFKKLYVFVSIITTFRKVGPSPFATSFMNAV